MTLNGKEWVSASEVQVGDIVYLYVLNGIQSEPFNDIGPVIVKRISVNSEVNCITRDGVFYRGRLDMKWLVKRANTPASTVAATPAVTPRGKCDRCWSWRCPGC